MPAHEVNEPLRITTIPMTRKRSSALHDQLLQDKQCSITLDQNAQDTEVLAMPLEANNVDAVKPSTEIIDQNEGVSPIIERSINLLRPRRRKIVPLFDEVTEIVIPNRNALRSSTMVIKKNLNYIKYYTNKCYAFVDKKK